MSKSKHLRLSPALVISVIALFVAIGGVAGALPGKNSVDSGDIKKNAVKSVDISNKKGVKSPDVVKNALTGRDLKESTLSEVPKANQSNAANTADRANRLDVVRFVRSEIVPVASGADGSAVANCPTGTFASGGGGTYPAASGVQVLRSVPSNGTVGEAGFTAWEFRIRNGAGVPRNLRAYAVCVPVDDATGNYAPGNAVD